ncbi:MAG TPA: GNAT family N-acetyltransferase [Thermoanaerobaculia bacterium]|nr:GNAT family N-acetyltransferase [Thermoanaerobaculia bacterium]
MVGDEKLARRLESFQAAVSAEMAVALNRVAPEVHAAVLPVGEGNALFAGPDSPLTQAIAVDGEVERIEAFFLERGADSIIQVNPWSPRSLTDPLTARHYAFHEFENVFACVVERRPSPAAGEPIEVREATDIPLWARIAAEAFASEEMSADVLETIMTPFAHVEHARCYIAYVGGEAAGSAAMFALPDRKIAGLFGAGTGERFRNRGVQTALLHRRLADAAKMGCEIAMVTTQPGSASHRNVARRGFELLYTKVSMRLDRRVRRA